MKSIINIALLAVLLFIGCDKKQDTASLEMSNQQIEDLVRRSFHYVAIYNVNNKGAIQKESM